jgi:CheY-like chemotaxis protein
MDDECRGANAISMKKKILIVDDEEPVLFVLSGALGRLADELDIATVSSGEEAVEEVRASPFDLVITDMIMPGMDGVELTQRIRSLNPRTAVIWMTAYGSQRFEAEAERLEVRRCLDKPVEIQEIRQVVREALELTK